MSKDVRRLKEDVATLRIALQDALAALNRIQDRLDNCDNKTTQDNVKSS